MTTLQPLVKYLRQQGDGAQTKLARKAVCSDGHLSLVLKGKRGMSPELAKRISDATGIPIQSLRPDLAKLFEAAE